MAPSEEDEDSSEVSVTSFRHRVTAVRASSFARFFNAVSYAALIM
jgi:hypothetical protein